MDPRLIVHIALRTKKYDDIARNFLHAHPQGVVVNLGCGLDPRFYRIDNGSVRFFDLDHPAMVSIKRRLLEENKRYMLIGQSILDFSWMDAVKDISKATLFLAEGILMYLPEAQVKKLVLSLQTHFPGSELVCELTRKIWVEGFFGKLVALKMQHRTKIGGTAKFKFGVTDARELETWRNGIELLEKWFYMDDNHPKLGWIRVFRRFRLFRNTQFTAHYRLNPTQTSY